MAQLGVCSGAVPHHTRRDLHTNPCTQGPVWFARWDDWCLMGLCTTSGPEWSSQREAHTVYWGPAVSKEGSWGLPAASGYVAKRPMNNFGV